MSFLAEHRTLPSRLRSQSHIPKKMCARDLVHARYHDRSTWPPTTSLPIQFNRPPFDIHFPQPIPKEVRDTIKLAADCENLGCAVRDVVGAVLGSHGADIQSQLSDEIGGRMVNCDSMTGSINHILRVIFPSSYYVYGNRRMHSDEVLAWNLNRGPTDLQSNELLAIITAAQLQLYNRSAERQEVCQT